MKSRARESWLACRTIFALLLAVSPVRAVEPDRLAPMLASVTNLLRATMPEPSLEVKLPGAITARSALFRQTQWKLKHQPQSATVEQESRQRAMALPETERHNLMNRFDDFSQLWLVRLDAYPGAGATLKETLPPCAQTIAISLATATTKGGWRAANDAGVEILRALPGGQGRKLARRVADSIPEDWCKEMLQRAVQ